MKPRIVITIVTETGSTNFTLRKGDELVSGGKSLGPSEKQIKIAHKAIHDICKVKS